MAQGRHAHQRSMRALVIVGIVAGVLIVALGGIAYSAYRYEQVRADRILPGVTIAGVDVSGMTRSEAISAVRGHAAVRLGAPIHVSAGTRHWSVTPTTLGQRAAAAVAVHRALMLNKSMGTFSRFWHRFRDESVHRMIPLHFGGAQGVDGFLEGVAKAVQQDPIDAALTTDGDQLITVKPKNGQALDMPKATSGIRAALANQKKAVRLPMDVVKPKVTTDQLGATVVVRVDQNRLYLYDGLKVARTWPVATAMPPWTTPSGDWIVDRKAVDPTWYNPAPDGWASSAPLVVPGGPDNPMGTRALYITAPGLIRIHGTSPSERPSIGHYESHGCIRMLNEDVEQLYPLVPVGTHVLIVGHRPY